jgi:DNA mismatch repair protein MutL
MPHIQQLSPHVADLIAAGEVVERPASVVKELLENAIDAGAQSVTVEMKNGGMTYLRVSDDGCGIAPSELPTAFLRHATSKLRTAEDLAAIGTLGFRGEALAAISSVSRLDIFSRERGALSGAKLHLEGGVPGTVEDAGCPEGTSVIVRDLFYNTPARLKFMKRDSAEATAIAGLVAHLALSHPEVSFKLIKDGTQTLLTPGDGALRSAIYASLGREFALSLEEVKGADSELRVTGFISSPLSARGTRGMQTFFVNGRLVKSQLLTAALEEAYANRMMKGKFPGCVLLVELPRDMVDVNVHPAKTIVKFVGEKRIFDLVYHAAMAALDKREKPEPPQAKPAAQVQNPRGDFFANMTSQQYREQQKAEPSAAAPPSSAPQWKTRVPAVDTRAGGSAPLSDFVRHEMPASAQAAQPVQRSVKAVENPAREAVPLPMDEEEKRPFAASPVAEAAKGAGEPVTEPPAVSATKQEEAEAEQASFAPLTAAPWRIAGEVLDTYIICEDEDKTIWLIDKHAAHERMNFDRLKAAQEPVMCQALLAPLVADFAAEEYSALAANLDLLREFGFECEEFGGGSLILRAIPADLESGDAIPTLEELAEKLVTAHTADPAAARDALLHTMACKAAIKGGWKSDISELRVLVEKVQSGEVQFCPHGRPVKAKLTKYELEKMFKRA